MKNKAIYFILGLVFIVSCTSIQRIDLSGEWTVALDSLDTGIENQWFNKNFKDRITLPGTLCDGGYGIPCTTEPVMEREVFLNLKRKYDYIGAAWYKKTVEIPKNWEQKAVFLHLERVIWNSQVWIDGKKVDTVNESLIAPHRFDISNYLTPGRQHTICLRIDNRKKYDISWRDMGHAYTNETQTMWNGILGDILLEARNKTHIEDFQIFPDIDQGRIHVKLRLQSVGQPKGKISFSVKEVGGKSLSVKTVDVFGAELSFDYEIDNPKLWDEFDPRLYEAAAKWRDGKDEDTKNASFGMRKLTNKNALLQINGRRIFLRGTLECCIFPLKGYPPTNRNEWEKVFTAARSYGLNHIRFHSWCPPKAAFEAADKMGFYLQVELPLWALNIGADQSTVNFLYDESNRIIKEYGNHPSFCFWSVGNELGGDFSIIDDLMMTAKKQDPRHLYVTTSFAFQRGHGRWPEANDDFWITQWTKKGWVRGQGIFDDQPVNFDTDYSAAIDSLPVPIVTHEIGQYSVFPNLEEINKYTGNLLPLNFIAVKNDLKKKGLLHLADDYLKASGKLAVILYKEEIERALKTPGFSGFQLLDLHDFPGQGTALVGILDAFWESKGLVQENEFRNFCSPVVPLVRFAKATYTNKEVFEAETEVANFGNSILKNVVPVWKLVDSKGNTMSEGQLEKKDIAVGNNHKTGRLSVDLSKVTVPEKLTLHLSLSGFPYQNSWEIWVYPDEIDEAGKNVLYTRDFEMAGKALEQGKTVLFNPKPEDTNGLEGKFVQVFWSPIHFPNQPGTMGIFCNPEHPAFNSFPTDMHTNWQWWDICKSGKTLELDAFGDVQPIVRMVDNFYKNRNLGLVFEAKSGNGKLLICSADLEMNLDKRPVARQLRYSLANYMESPGFDPEFDIPFDRIKATFYNANKETIRKKSIYEP